MFSETGTRGHILFEWVDFIQAALLVSSMLALLIGMDHNSDMGYSPKKKGDIFKALYPRR